MTVEFLPEAQDDLWEAVSFYESRETGLGVCLRDEVARVVTRIAADPLLWRERPGGYRRVNCPVFPYYVAYVIRRQTIVITAIAHGHRRPGFWSGRG